MHTHYPPHRAPLIRNFRNGVLQFSRHFDGSFRTSSIHRQNKKPQEFQKIGSDARVSVGKPGAVPTAFTVLKDSRARFQTTRVIASPGELGTSQISGTLNRKFYNISFLNSQNRPNYSIRCEIENRCLYYWTAAREDLVHDFSIVFPTCHA